MDIFSQQFQIIDNGLRGCVFGDYIVRNNTDNDHAWGSIMNMCYAEAVISWNQIFGQTSQETHWSKLVSQITIPPGDKLKIFNKEMILKYLKISEDEWVKYHQSMVDFRNVRIAHLNIQHTIEVIPDITKAMHCLYLYREWLTEVLHFGVRQGFNIKICNDKAADTVRCYKEQIHKAFNRL
ncbi:hypothetical protein L5M18_08745 [Shewanella sp. SM20]|uniref:hypothetical protein n=1 Tax=Shewanella sp. SM20 TaxID=2912792 RepID=UPI0021D85377|nr:hypothetical protein [Shewanella sp. SM20]MCU8091650.1 hypothetical protein [Shewanella sp. SM20]